MNSTPLRIMVVIALVSSAGRGCGGSVLAPTPDASMTGAASTDAAPLTDAQTDGTEEAGSNLVACASACITAAGGGGGGCPVLLTYACLSGPCGMSASTAICAAGDGTPPSVSTIVCAQAAFPQCPSNSCQNDRTCLAFVACIEACH